MFYNFFLLDLLKIKTMKKNKLTTVKRKAAAKRGQKRADRLKKTQETKHLRRADFLLEKEAKNKKLKDAMDKLLQSRFAK